jgi:predicted dehydrogenase
MSLHRIAVAGAGWMARHRGQALLATGRAEIVAVASLHLESARQCAVELGCREAYDDFRRLPEAGCEALLIETPHDAQEMITLWALGEGLDLLIGGALATSVEAGRRIVELAARGGRVVEAGYDSRYDPVWEETRDLIQRGELGEPVMATSTALWAARPGSWYYDQRSSGGLPITHLSYQFANLARWILGRPTSVSAVANRKRETSPERVIEESLAALLLFESGAFYSAAASYIKPGGMTDPDVRFLCTHGAIQIHHPASDGSTSISVFRDSGRELRTSPGRPSPMVRQAHAFLDALETRSLARNPPDDVLLDLQVAEAVSAAAREGRTVLV